MLISLLCIYLLWLFPFSGARLFTLEIHHRFSDHVKEWSRQSGTGFPVDSWPERGSIKYYALLASHDRAIKGRVLSGSGGALTFSDGITTFRISSLGFLHYTTVTLGTPGMKFLVALDTGSELFWVPCRCQKCASADTSPYTSDFELRIYDPDGSSTSRNVSCDSDLCTDRGSCSDTSSHCPYYVSYVSSKTSTSGILVEDVLQLRTLDMDQEVMKVYVTFGCGQVQTGSFLDIAAPNGLFGLGLDKVSVPSILVREGYTENSFSMCFGHDGTGKIYFGDKGSIDQEETPFSINSFHPTYSINVTQVRVGTTVLDSQFTALFDSGTSFTYLVEPSYTLLADSFDFHIRDSRRPPDPRIPFEYCYTMSPEMNTSLIPVIGLSMDGGGQLVVYDPIVVISTRLELVYCLAVVKSQDLDIIGQNFMTGYRIVFDREKLVLGWKKSDCHDIEDGDAVEPRSVNSASAPKPVSAGLPNGVTVQSTEPSRNFVAQNSFSSSLFRCKYALICFFLITSACLVLSMPPMANG